MSIWESIGMAVSVTSFILVTFSMVKNNFINEDFKLAMKHLFDSSNKISKRAVSYVKVIEIVADDVVPFWKYNKKVFVHLNSSLISAISTLDAEFQEASAEKRKANSVVGVMLLDRLKRSTKIQINLILCLAVNFLLSLLPAIDFSYFLLTLVSLLILAIHADQKLIDYRVKRGWYGKNEFEAREIINFIVSHSNKDDFNGSGGLKKIIPLPEIEAEKNEPSPIGGAIV